MVGARRGATRRGRPHAARGRCGDCLRGLVAGRGRRGSEDRRAGLRRRRPHRSRPAGAAAHAAGTRRRLRQAAGRGADVRRCGGAGLGAAARRRDPRRVVSGPGRRHRDRAGAGRRHRSGWPPAGDVLSLGARPSAIRQLRDGRTRLSLFSRHAAVSVRLRVELYPFRLCRAQAVGSRAQGRRSAGGQRGTAQHRRARRRRGGAGLSGLSALAAGAAACAGRLPAGTTRAGRTAARALHAVSARLARRRRGRHARGRARPLPRLHRRRPARRCRGRRHPIHHRRPRGAGAMTLDSLTRRDLLKLLGGSAAALAMPDFALAAAAPAARFASHRPPVAKRKFSSAAVEAEIARVQAKIGDPELAWMFGNCYPNTLDTTVQMDTLHGKPDTFVITGDIDAMWLRDSSAQVWPYLPLAAKDESLRRLYRGLIRRQALCIAIDPYANAFLPDPRGKTTLDWAQHDLTDMKPGVAERKWEIDSLCWTIRIAHGYWKATGDRTPFDDDWRGAVHLVLATFREQQRKHGPGPYHFQRASAVPTDTVPLGGFGNPAKPVGLIWSMFRPSDDACIYPLFVPANAYAVVSLRQLAEMSRALHGDVAFAADCEALASEVQAALEQHAVMHEDGADFWAYEVDGYGNQLFMDD